ncbi:MAG: hypothetical protein U0575_07395 [Phycisphaerales bacterium]
MPPTANNFRLNQRELSQCLGVCVQGLQQSWLKFIPPDAIDTSDSRRRYRPAAVVAIWRERLRREKSKLEATHGDGWPARLLRAKALRAEAELAALQGRLLDTDAVHEAMAIVVSELRNAGDRFRAEFGDAAADLLGEIIDRIDRALAVHESKHGRAAKLALPQEDATP